MKRVAVFLILVMTACGDAPVDPGSTMQGADSAAPDSEPMTGEDAATTTEDAQTNDSGSTSAIVPPIGGSSGGSGGAAPVSGSTAQASGVTYRLIVPANPSKPSALMIVFSGTEGGNLMTQNLIGAGPSTGTQGFIRAVLDGVVYNGNGAAGEKVLDDVRSKYDIDNDRTYLLGESAGTTAALKLGFKLRQSYFAAYWANDVNQNDVPGQTKAMLGFAPWGQVGPGGDFGDANIIANGMKAAGYRTPVPCPYAGPGAGTHGDPNQFLAALQFFPGKTRQ
jgi:hypothetical protein